jgi:hypothetical protein
MMAEISKPLPFCSGAAESEHARRNRSLCFGVAESQPATRNNRLCFDAAESDYVNMFVTSFCRCETVCIFTQMFS